MKPSNVIERLLELEAKATPGPWSVLGSKCEVWLKEITCGYEGEMDIKDAQLIVEMRNALPMLLAVVGHLEYAERVLRTEGYDTRDIRDALAALEAK